MSPPGRWPDCWGALTAPQAGMWLDGAGDASSATYNIGNYVRLVGDLDVEALARAISQTDAESDCAQLRFVQQDGLPLQRLAEKAAPTDFAVIDLCHAPDPAAAARLEMEAFRRRPFDKEAGPLCGHRLLRLGPDEHWWFRSYSHLITDGLSSHILAERTAQIYNASKRGEAPPEAWFGRYADFIAEDEAYPGSAAYERDVTYWRERLANGGPASRFKPGNDTAGIEVAEFPARLDAGRIAGLQALAERSKASLAAVAMAVYYLLLGRMAGTQQPTALTPFGNRLGRQERSTPGAFAFALPCTVDLAGKHSIGDLARDIFGQLKRDMRHMRLAPIRMRATLGRSNRPDADGAGVNIIGVVPPLSFDGLSASVVNFYTGLTSDISLIFVGEELGDGGTGAYLHWRYNAALYTRAEVARIAARFEHLLDRVLADPDQPLADLTLAPEAEIATIRRWEAGPAIPAEMQAPLLPARIADVMRRFPDHIAIIADDGTETRYGQLDRLASAIERNLLKAGVQRGDLVGLGCLPGPALVAGLIALWRRGAAAVMLDPVLPIARRRAMAEKIDVRLVLCDGATLWPDADRGAIQPVDLSGWMTEAAGEDSAGEGVEPADNDIAIVFHTAGSTGQPKPVAVPHGALCRKVVSVVGHYALGSADAGNPETVVLSPAMGFDPWIQELGMALITGARLWTMRRETLLDGHRFWEAATRHGATYINLTPTAMEGLIDSAPLDGRHAVRHVVLGGEIFSPELAARLRAVLGDAALWNGYGPTETVVDITAYRLPQRFSGDRVPIGPVSPGGLVRVIGPDGRRAPIGMQGELYLGGACVSLGYISMPEATAAAFLPDPVGETEGVFYRSGDLASWEEDGTLTYRGRNDSQVKLRGQRIELGEVESCLRRLPGIAQAAVLHVGDSHGGHLRAFVTRAPDAGGDIAPASIRQALARYLPEAAIPSAIAVLESLPHLPSGKINRAALAALPEQAAAVPAPGRALPGLSARQHQVQQAVAAVWRDLIGAGEIDPQANLFDIGAHSLLVLRAQGRLGRIAGREVSAVEVFEHPSIATFARYLTHGSDTEAPAAARQPLAADRPGAIAIIGMGMRLPGADNRADFWSLLEAGRDCVRDIDAARLRAFGVDPSLLQDPGFVARHGLLEEIDGFDPAPFGMTPADTLETDPQQRLLLETALTALEDACCDPVRDGPVGVYVGVGFPTYLLDALAPQRTTNTLDMARYALAIGNDKDHAATRLAYKLNLTGPAIAAGTACSTGLVNVASAVQALRAGQCRVALAGGAALGTGVTGGYRFAEGGIGSRSGVCRPFDSQADGVVGGSGAAIVALKRLEDALADGDTVHAVILGVGLSNDGARKAAFTAPSVEGQAAALSAALADAGVAPGSISFIEAHGTATSLGDPIEVAALNQAYGPRQDRPIWLGSLKGNMGHLDAAAGIAGLLKAVLALQHRMVPPNCHFQQPNPRIPFDRGPFQVADRPVPLDAGETPLRAGVSSFGVGGTNAHVILEAAPTRPDIPAASAALAKPQILIFSAASEKPLDALLRRTADSFAGDLATVDMADIAFSLRARRRYPHRV
ncbi:MAG: AMP-binding protein, partial [Alphaproteobacteria bacterium]|nr:AMP-binding protein [Alphaproteobacteria bacterium]